MLLLMYEVYEGLVEGIRMAEEATVILTLTWFLNSLCFVILNMEFAFLEFLKILCL